MKISPASLSPYRPIGGAVSLRDLETSKEGSFVSIDGNIHNCESLLEVYRSKGTDAFGDLLGEFVCVLWDSEKRRLVCARDRVGVKSFFYHFDGKVLFFSSCLTDLVKMPGVSYGVDEETIAFALVNDWTDLERTFYKGIFRLPPAHFLSLTSDGLRIQPYWRFSVGSDIRYSREEQYIDHLKELLREAVRCRLPKNEERFAVTVSGGVDSSVVACLADELKPGCLEALSMYFDDPEADDRAAIESLISEKKWPHHIVYPERNPKDMEMDFGDDYRDLLYYPGFFALRPLLRMANKLGLSSILTGFGADDLFSPTMASRLFLIRYGGWPQLVRSFLPPGFLRMIRRVAPRKPPYWVAPRLAQRYPLTTRMGTRFRENQILPRMWQRDLYNRLFLWGGYAFDFDQEQLLARVHGVQLSYPLFDWRLIDYAFRIPVDLFYRKGWTKWIFRQAAKGIIPDRLLFQKDPYDSRGVEVRTIDHQASVFQNWINDSLLVREGFIDEKGLHKLWGQRNLVSLWEPLFHVLTFEKWLRTLQREKVLK